MVDHLKPLCVPAGSDTIQAIGLPPKAERSLTASPFRPPRRVLTGTRGYSRVLTGTQARLPVPSAPPSASASSPPPPLATRTPPAPLLSTPIPCSEYSLSTFIPCSEYSREYSHPLL